LLELFSFMFLIFGLALLATAIQLYRHRDQDPHPADNLLVNVARRVLPLTSNYDESKIITRRDGRRLLTPLFLALLAIGSTDILFAFDSIPAVFGVTDHAYIVFAANAFALLGLRPLFFLVSGLLDRLVYMSTGLPVILAFIGLKLVLEFAHEQNHAIPEISTIASLAVITSVLGATTIASVIRSRRTPDRRAHAGALRRAREQPGRRDSQPADIDPASPKHSGAPDPDRERTGAGDP
jgi:tellurite resistance protein TerC